MHNNYTKFTKLYFGKYYLALLFATVLLSTANAQVSVNNLWKDIQISSSLKSDAREIIPLKYRTISIEIDKVKAMLQNVPAEGSLNVYKIKTELSIPMPDGNNCNFYVFDSPIMAPELAAQYPEIKTYIVKGIENPSISGRVDVTQFGFHAILFTPEGTVYVDPYEMYNTNNYISYYKKDFYKEETFAIKTNCVIDNPAVRKKIEELLQNGEVRGTGSELKKYRLALSATGEYTAYYGGTVAGALSGMVTTINRVNSIYEKELDIRMILVANTSKLIFTNASKDPFTNDDGDIMLTQNQTLIDTAIGNANYDIGHVFSTGGGGVAYLGVICETGSKAGGVTGSSSPIGDPFDVDYVAHEMGHQFGANHPFNGSTENCSGGNRNAGTAYEPGSGTTIMAYAGICAPQNIQMNGDDYFHIVNIDEITAYTSGLGYSCATITKTNNTAPVVTVGVSGLKLPIKTPFALTGSAVDAEKDTITYCWEEFDLGPQGGPNSPSGTAPIFRSFKPSTSPTRLFPQLSDILNNKQTMGEILPTYSRALTFRLSARDNKGGIGTSTIQFSVDQTAGPFLVTYPNTNVSWKSSTKQTITWNVANTTNANVNCQKVNILLSTDGGKTFPYILVSNTPNDGSEEIIVPGNATTAARIKVEAADNVFFDLSDVNFSITISDVPVELTMFKAVDTKNGVHLAWETATETNNKGFYVERSKDKKTYESVTFVNGKGTTAEKSSYNYVDNSVSKGLYSYRLKQVDNDGTFSYSNVIDVDLNTTYNFSLEQNYPNPFNPSTTIRYTLQSETKAVLKVFNVLGKEVAELVNAQQPAGNYKVEFSVANLPSGLYFYQLTAGNNTISKKMITLK